VNTILTAESHCRLPQDRHKADVAGNSTTPRP
jgi:hypothetical protein